MFVTPNKETPMEVFQRLMKQKWFQEMMKRLSKK